MSPPCNPAIVRTERCSAGNTKPKNQSLAVFVRMNSFRLIVVRDLTKMHTELDLRSIVEPLSTLDSWSTGPHSEHEDSIKSNLSKLAAPRLLLSYLFTSELSKTTMALAKDVFVLPLPDRSWPRSFVLPSDESAYSCLSLPDPAAAWSVSRHTTTYRLACLVTSVRLFLNYTGQHVSEPAQRMRVSASDSSSVCRHSAGCARAHRLLFYLPW